MHIPPASNFFQCCTVTLGSLSAHAPLSHFADTHTDPFSLQLPQHFSVSALWQKGWTICSSSLPSHSVGRKSTQHLEKLQSSSPPHQKLKIPGWVQNLSPLVGSALLYSDNYQHTSLKRGFHLFPLSAMTDYFLALKQSWKALQSLLVSLPSTRRQQGDLMLQDIYYLLHNISSPRMKANAIVDAYCSDLCIPLFHLYVSALLLYSRIKILWDGILYQNGNVWKKGTKVTQSIPKGTVGSFRPFYYSSMRLSWEQSCTSCTTEKTGLVW